MATRAHGWQPGVSTCCESFAGSRAARCRAGATGAPGTPSTGCRLPPGGGESIVNLGATVEQLAGTARSVIASSPVREGEFATITVQGAPGEFALIAYSGEFQAGTFAPQWRAPPLVGAPQQLVALGALPATGSASLGFIVGELGSGVEGARAVAQGVFVDPSAMTVQLGSASEIVLLDAGF